MFMTPSIPPPGFNHARLLHQILNVDGRTASRLVTVSAAALRDAAAKGRRQTIPRMYCTRPPMIAKRLRACKRPAGALRARTCPPRLRRRLAVRARHATRTAGHTPGEAASASAATVRNLAPGRKTA
jgi:hypothetical protein